METDFFGANFTRKDLDTKKYKNRANFTRKDLDIQKYKLQRILVFNVNREAKRDFYRNLDPKIVGKRKISGEHLNLFYLTG